MSVYIRSQHIMVERTVSVHELLRIVCETTRVQAWATTCMLTSDLKIDH